MKNVRGMNLNIVGEAKIKIGKNHVRPEDGSRYTIPPLDQKRSRRRAVNRRARAARRRNR